MTKKLMTLEEVAEYLQMSKTTVYRLAQQGKLPTTKIGNLWRFNRDLIDEWVIERSKNHIQDLKKRSNL